ncbi:MAG: SUF system NifU family Fe-S cluster assembly protein [Deltaproteobacteria bacterium]|nr:SUF system NifU family Fe-S cluster assembly protein [Deltaproteobacteria bacterium]
MSDLRELYQELILDHSKKPRNFRVLEGAPRRAEGFNALCGDRFTVFVQMEGERIEDIAFQGSGCAVSKASASMMTAALKGKTREEASALLAKFHDLVTGQGSPDHPVDLGKLQVFAGVCEFPARVKCATLAWHTLGAALEGKDAAVSTE